MKKCIFWIMLFCAQISSGQNIVLSGGSHTVQNNDKRLYKVTSGSGGQFLGEIEIVGPLTDPVAAFNNFYKKSKILGANAYVPVSNPDIEGKEIATNLHKLHLYYFEQLPVQNNIAFILNPGKARKFRINGNKVELPADSFYTLELQDGKEISVATGGFLGSTVSLTYKLCQPAVFLTLNSGGLGTSHDPNNGGIIIKSGDLVQLESSFGAFFTLFYTHEN